MNESYE